MSSFTVEPMRGPLGVEDVRKLSRNAWSTIRSSIVGTTKRRDGRNQIMCSRLEDHQLDWIFAWPPFDVSALAWRCP